MASLLFTHTCRTRITSPFIPWKWMHPVIIFNPYEAKMFFFNLIELYECAVKSNVHSALLTEIVFTWNSQWLKKINHANCVAEMDRKRNSQHCDDAIVISAPKNLHLAVNFQFWFFCSVVCHQKSHSVTFKV